MLSMTVVYTSSELGNTALRKKTLKSLNIADQDTYGPNCDECVFPIFPFHNL